MIASVTLFKDLMLSGYITGHQEITGLHLESVSGLQGLTSVLPLDDPLHLAIGILTVHILKRYEFTKLSAISGRKMENAPRQI